MWWQCVFENSVFHIAVYGRTQDEASKTLKNLLNGKLYHYAGEYKISQVAEQMTLIKRNQDNSNVWDAGIIN